MTSSCRTSFDRSAANRAKGSSKRMSGFTLIGCRANTSVSGSPGGRSEAAPFLADEDGVGRILSRILQAGVADKSLWLSGEQVTQAVQILGGFILDAAD